MYVTSLPRRHRKLHTPLICGWADKHLGPAFPLLLTWVWLGPDVLAHRRVWGWCLFVLVRVRMQQALTLEQSRLSNALEKPDPLANEERLRRELQGMLSSIYQQVSCILVAGRLPGHTC